MRSLFSHPSVCWSALTHQVVCMRCGWRRFPYCHWQMLITFVMFAEVWMSLSYQCQLLISMFCNTSLGSSEISFLVFDIELCRRRASSTFSLSGALCNPDLNIKPQGLCLDTTISEQCVFWVSYYTSIFTPQCCAMATVHHCVAKTVFDGRWI